MYTTRLRADKMAALKEKDTVKNKVITMLLSGLTYKHKELGRDCTEQECLDVIAKELKQQREALELSKGREDKAAEILAEIAILESYLPKQMGAAAVAEIIAKAGLETTVKNKGMIMKTVMGELKGKADGKVIGAAVDALLS